MHLTLFTSVHTSIIVYHTLHIKLLRVVRWKLKEIAFHFLNYLKPNCAIVQSTKKNMFNFIHTRRFQILSKGSVVRTLQFILLHPLFESERVQDFFSRKNLKQLSCIGPVTEGLTKIIILFGAWLNSTSPSERFVVILAKRRMLLNP